MSDGKRSNGKWSGKLTMLFVLQVNVTDRDHLMPIITPAYPQQNTTCNVSPSTFTIITEEIQRGVYSIHSAAAIKSSQNNNTTFLLALMQNHLVNAVL